MIQTLVKIRDRLITWKVYLFRANGYMLFVTMSLSIYLTLSDFRTGGWEFNYFNIKLNFLSVYIICLIVGLLGAIFVGWLDRKLKLHKGELKEVTAQNPLFMELMAMTKEIQEEQKRLKSEGEEVVVHRRDKSDS